MDCFAVQHPDGAESDPRQRGSVAVHLMCLCLRLEHRIPLDRLALLRSHISRTVLPRLSLPAFPYLRPPSSFGDVTAVDVHAAIGTADFDAAGAAWAEASWRAWSPHHTVVHHWATVAAGGPR